MSGKVASTHSSDSMRVRLRFNVCISLHQVKWISVAIYGCVFDDVRRLPSRDHFGNILKVAVPTFNWRSVAKRGKVWSWWPIDYSLHYGSIMGQRGGWIVKRKCRRRMFVGSAQLNAVLRIVAEAELGSYAVSKYAWFVSCCVTAFVFDSTKLRMGICWQSASCLPKVETPLPMAFEMN